MAEILTVEREATAQVPAKDQTARNQAQPSTL